MESKDKTKEQLIKELQELQKKYNSLYATVGKGHGIKKNEDYFLNKLNHATKEFIQFSADTPDYKKILRVIIDISGAKYTALNIFDENGLDFTTVAFEGIKKNILKGIDFLGFDLKNKHWDHDPIRAEKTKKVITRFMHLNELTGDVIPKSVIYLIEKTFGIEETFVVKIFKDEKVLGDFTLLFKKGETLINSSLVELYANQVGLFLERQKLTNLLSNSEKQFSQLFENMEQGFAFHEMIYDNDNKPVDYRFLLVNKAFERLTGINTENLINKTVKEILPNTEQIWIDNSGKVAQTGIPIHFDTYSQEFDKYYDVIAYSPKKDFFAVVFTDITDIKESETKLQQLNADKDRFISILSHDLKSPFNILLGFSEILTNNFHEYSITKIREYVNHINKATQNANNLLEDLLKWSRAQKGDISFSPQKLLFTNICEDILPTLKPNADAKKIKINYSSADHINVFADVDMLKTVLRNLVSNAIKFTNNGGEISINAEQTESDITITVSDNGIGIPPDNLAKLFDISEVITTKGTAQETGTGLGLLICKEFVEKHGGKIWVESQEGKGTVFYFTIPDITDDGLRISNKKVN